MASEEEQKEVTRRALLVDPRFRKALARLGIDPGTERARAVGRAVARLAECATLPAVHDAKVLVPPTSHAFVRRVQGRNIWLWFRIVRGGVVQVIHVSSDPPIPLE